MLTLDASVFLQRASPNGPDYAVCRDLLNAIKTSATRMYEPMLVLPEVAGAVSRIFRDPMRGRVYADLLRDLPNTTYVRLMPRSAGRRKSWRRTTSYVAPMPPMPLWRGGMHASW